MHASSRFACWLRAGALLLCVPLYAADSVPFPAAFWNHWQDGLAELSGYDLITPRYGEPRAGVAVAIFVKEPFSNTLRVKADPSRHPASDEFQVMKLNLMRDFPTGVYDYNLMTSVFVGLTAFGGQAAGETAKVSFSAQEWCGQMYAQLLFRARGVEETSHSYFDGEGDEQRTWPREAVGISEDALPLWARGMAAPFLQPGETRDVPILTSLMTARLLHQPIAWQRVRLTRAKETSWVEVPAGRFRVTRSQAVITAGRTWTFDVESAFPHRLIRWQTSDGEEAKLLRSTRLPYWNLKTNQNQEELRKLGLSPRPRRMP